MLSCLDEVFELMENNNITQSEQFGFKKTHSKIQQVERIEALEYFVLTLKGN